MMLGWNCSSEETWGRSFSKASRTPATAPATMASAKRMLMPARRTPSNRGGAATAADAAIAADYTVAAAPVPPRGPAGLVVPVLLRARGALRRVGSRRTLRGLRGWGRRPRLPAPRRRPRGLGRARLGARRPLASGGRQRMGDAMLRGLRRARLAQGAEDATQHLAIGLRRTRLGGAGIGRVCRVQGRLGSADGAHRMDGVRAGRGH